MKSGFSANFQNCVTCAYWGGARSLNSTRTRAEYDVGVVLVTVFMAAEGARVNLQLPDVQIMKNGYN
jgi:hypothetical protein